MSVSKKYITPDELRADSYALGMAALKDGFRPTFLVALWRGGAPIGCYVHELLKWKGCNSDHIAIRTSRYTGIDATTSDDSIVVHSTSYLTENLKPGDSIMLVDDVWDSGTTIVAFFNKLRSSLSFPLEQIDVRVATVYYKPTRNRTTLKPHYFMYDTTAWLVFPHELEGMDEAEVEKAMGKKILDIISQ